MEAGDRQHGEVPDGTPASPGRGSPAGPASDCAARGPAGRPASDANRHPLSPRLHQAVDALRRLVQEQQERDAALAKATERLAQRVRARTAMLAMLAQEWNAGDARFLALAASLPQPVWTCRADGRREYCNRRWAALTGQGSAAARDLGWLDAVHPEHRGLAAACWGEAAGRGGAVLMEHRLRGTDGNWRWFETQALPIGRRLAGGSEPEADGSGPEDSRWVCACTDVHARKLAEAAVQKAAGMLRQEIAAARMELTESEARFRAVFPISRDALFVVACMPDGRLLHEALNQPFERLTGLWSERAEGREARAFMPAASAAIFEENYRRCAGSSEPHSFVALLALPAGDRMLRVSLLPALGSSRDGATRCLLGAARDIGNEAWPLPPVGLDA